MGTAALAERVRAGDRAAFAELYDEFADRIYRFCDALLRDRDEAADATHDVFVLVAQRIGQLRDPDRLGAWLFAIARHVCFRRLEQRRRVTFLDLESDVLVFEDDAIDALSADEAASLVWAAAAGLNDRDRAVLYLNAREGLEGAELAAALGVQHSNPYSMLHRAKAQLERALGVLLVARTGRRDCASLTQMLDGWDGVLTPLLRKRLGRHVERCPTCRATRLRANPLSALALAPLVRPGRAGVRSNAMSPAASPRTVALHDLLDIASRSHESPERWQRDGFPPPIDARRRRRRRMMVLAVAGLSLGIATLPLAPALGGPGGRPRHPLAGPTRLASDAARDRNLTTTIASPRRTQSRPTTKQTTNESSGASSNPGSGPAGAGAPVATTVPERVQVSPATLHATVPQTVPPAAGPPTTKPPANVTTTTKVPGTTTPTTIDDT